MSTQRGACPIQSKIILRFVSTFLLVLMTLSAKADTYSVTNLETTGAGSLQQAILDANAHPGADRIEFHIEGTAPFVIAPEDALPPITDPVTLDGTTQEGYVDRPLVAIDSSFLNSSDASGFVLNAPNCTVKGLAFTGFGGAGILVRKVRDCRIEKCVLGVTSDGSTPFGNGYGVAIVDSLNTVIENCVISGNSTGIYLNGTATDNVVRNSFIGTDLAGWSPIPNVYGIVFSGAAVANNLVEQCLVSGNSLTGITLMDGTHDNKIQFNQIGLNIYRDPLANGLDGIEILSSPQNRIDTNVIVGSPAQGVLLTNPETKNNLLTGNFIYASVTGVLIEAGANNNSVGDLSTLISPTPNTLIGNLLAGVRLIGANTRDNKIAANEITGNSLHGVMISSSQNQILRNKIYTNTVQGVRITAKLEGGYPTGVRLQDNLIYENGDLGILLEGYNDTGANNLQPAPEIRSSDANTLHTFIVVRLKASPSKTYQVQVFSTANPDPSGYGQGEVLLGTGTVTTGANGEGNATLVVAPTDTDTFISTTATDPDGNTSEFSLVHTVGTARPSPVIETLSPDSVLLGSTATLISVRGSNFTTDSVMRWNDSDRATTFISETELRFTAPAADLTTPANFRITVYTPAPGGGISNEATFGVRYPLPTLTTLSPVSVLKGSNDFVLTVTGTGYYPVSKIRWNGADRTTTYLSPTQLSISVPKADVATAMTLPITVFTATPGGGESSPLLFTIINPVPTLTRLNPNSATAGLATMTFVVEGTNFSSGTKALWNGSPRTTFYISPTAVRMKLNAADMAASGVFNVSVSNPSPGGGISNTLPFTVNGFPQVSLLSAVATRSGEITVTFVLKNFGTSAAIDLRVVGSKLNGSATTSQVPKEVPVIEAGRSSAPISLTFPASVPAGSRVLTIQLSSLRRALTASRLVIVP